MDNIPKDTSQTNQSQVFEGSDFTPSANFLSRLKKIWQAFQYYARQVWPYINRLLNFIAYEVLKVIRGIVKIGLKQIGMFKE